MRTISAGIIGCGNIFPMHAKSIANISNARILAVCDIIPEKAKRAAQQYNCEYYLDYLEMLDAYRFDIIHICTPHYLHMPITLHAAERGINVLTEKPIGLNSNEGQKMIESARNSNIRLGVIFQNRYNPGTQIVKKAVDSGKLGKIMSCRLVITWKRTDEYYESTGWKGTWDKEGGGVVIDQAIHSIDLIRWIVNDEIDFVDANMGNRMHNKIEVEDYCEGIIQFRAGTIVSFTTMNYHAYDAPVEMEFYCENGCAKITGDSGSIIYNNGYREIANVDPNEFIDFGNGAKSYWGTSHAKQIKDLYTCILEKRDFAVDGNEAIKTQKIIDSIYLSGKTKKRIYL